MHWFQVKLLQYVCFCSSNNKAGEEEKALNIFEEIKIAYFRVKYFMLAIKIIVIKITKKGISSSRIKVMHSLQSKNMPVSGSTITKPFILLHLTIILG